MADGTQKHKNYPKESYLNHLSLIDGIPFTQREIDIVACVLNGRAAKRIASLLSISPKTVENHIRNIMIKLRCSSQEKIRDFIEKSGRFSLLKEHYANLLIQSFFEQQLIKMAPLISNPPHCLIFHHEPANDSKLMVTQLIHDLTLVGINIKSKIWEEKFSQIHCHELMHSESLNTILYNLSETFKKQLLLGNHFEDTLKSSLQNHPLKPTSNTLLFVEYHKKQSPSVNVVKKLDFLENDNYYFTFFETLKQILPTISIDNHYSEFKEYYFSLQHSLRSQNSQSFQSRQHSQNLQDKHNLFESSMNIEGHHQKNFSVILFNLFSKFNNHTLGLGIFCSLIILISFLLLHVNNPTSDPQNQTSDTIAATEELSLIEKENNNLIEISDTIIHNTDILEIKPRMLLLTDDIDQYLEKHQKIDSELSDCYKKILYLLERIHLIQPVNSSYLELFPLVNLSSSTKNLKQKIENDLLIQEKLLQAVIAINKSLLFYMSNINYSPNGQSTCNYELAINELKKVFYIIGIELGHTKNTKYHFYVQSLNSIMTDVNLDVLMINPQKAHFIIDDHKHTIFDKCFFIALQNYGMILRTQGDIGDAPFNIQARKKEILDIFEKKRMVEKIGNDENLQILADFYVDNDFSQNAFRKAFQVFELANSFNNDFLLQINYTPIILTQLGEIVKRIFNEENTAPDQLNIHKSIELHRRAYLQNSENIIVLNSYSKSLIDEVDFHDKHLKSIEVSTEHIVKDINTIFNNLGYTRTLSNNIEIALIVKTKNDFIKKFSNNDSSYIETVKTQIDKLIALTLKKHELHLEIYKCFDVAERTYRYALKKCEKGNAILEANLAYLLFVKHRYFQEDQEKNRNDINESIKKIQGGRKDEHKTLLLHKSTLQITLKKYKEALDTLYRYEFLAGNLNNPYLLYLRAIAKFGVKDYEGSNQDFMRALKVAELQKVYFSERGYMHFIRFDETMICTEELKDNIHKFVQNIGLQNNKHHLLLIPADKSVSHYFQEVFEYFKNNEQPQLTLFNRH